MKYRTFIAVAVITLIPILLFVGPRLAPQFLSVELWISDWRTSLLATTPRQQRKDILLVTITDDSLRAFAYRSPIDRQFIAKVIQKLDSAGARLIATDILFDQPTEPEKDLALLDVLKTVQTPMVLGIADSRTGLFDWQTRYQEQFISETGQAKGYLNIGYDRDGVVRYLPSPTKIDPARRSFSTAIAMSLGQAPGTRNQRIDFTGAPGDGNPLFAKIPAHLIVGDQALPQTVLHQLIKDKIVMFGGELQGQDHHPIPFSVMAKYEGGMAGLEIHAQILAQLLDGRKLTYLPPWTEFFVLFAFTSLGALLSGITVLNERRGR